MNPRYPRNLREYLLWAAGVAAAGFMLVMLWGWSGIYSVAASRGHWAPVEWFLHFVMQSSARTHAIAIKAPPLDDDNLVALGAGHFHSECASCHGAPGFSVGVVAQQMLPPPPRLEGEVLRWKDRELFWIVRNGIKYTGMPAFPSLERDDEVWAVVAFLKRLPALDEAGYRAFVFGKPGTAAETGRDIARLGSTEEAIGACARCHGDERSTPRSNLIPVLHGQSPEYLLTTLNDYAEGRRQSGIMQPPAAALSKSARGKVAEYYAGLKNPVSPTANAVAGTGRSIAEQGLPDQQIPACNQCHAGDALKSFPRLDGQHAEYMIQKLKLWKDGLKPLSGQAEIMAPIAQRLTSEQIELVSRYYAGQTAAAARQ